MALPSRSRTADIDEGDELFFVTTRNCFGNPSRDRSRIVAIARTGSAVARLEKPLKLAGRTFDRGFDLDIETLAPFRVGVELPPLVEELDAFPNKRAWSWFMRRPALRVSTNDARMLRRLVRPVGETPDEVIPAYLEWIDAHPNSHPKR